MKLRLHNNGLRLRLSQSEVARLGESGRVEDTISFAPGQTLSYSIESGPAHAASYEHNRIRVVIPEPETRHWIDSDEPGLENSAGPVRILIEKDFQCLHKPGEDADSFPNPLARD